MQLRGLDFQLGADIDALREAGYSRAFRDVRAGIKDYLDTLGSRP